jgi:hypothetical protein
MSKHNNGNKSHTSYRRNSDGRFVEKSYGESHPKSTTKERVPNPGYGTEGDRKR